MLHIQNMIFEIRGQRVMLDRDDSGTCPLSPPEEDKEWFLIVLRRMQELVTPSSHQVQ